MAVSVAVEVGACTGKCVGVGVGMDVETGDINGGAGGGDETTLSAAPALRDLPPVGVCGDASASDGSAVEANVPVSVSVDAGAGTGGGTDACHNLSQKYVTLYRYI